ncbi:enoyl-CoA hydratase-related protein [Caballeronia sp. LP003]|uniref:enoyl-CoA hydratase-related protein n=1 Tax=Caballeronia sp. LP003 TaxID=3038551 RepID=UPI0028653591|nr:enoyl-CoA hydratase-related protein [Caballeronia sp. LP003]MDR5785282.1 enoyl-CoA hydratase-related protein [Caballeronia sp. LP003]
MDQPKLVDAILDVSDRVATLTLDRDDVRNELTGTALADDIEKTVDWINRTDHVSVLLITGAGKSFSAGGNIKDMLAKRNGFEGDVYEIQRRYRQGIQRIPLALARLEVPSIAAINGAAIGAGLDLACMCDLRFSTADALMGESFINVGIIPGDGGGWTLQQIVGYQRAAELTFSGRLFNGVEAKQLGVVLEIFERDSLLERCLEVARSFAAKPPRALRLTKRLLKSAQRMQVGDFLDQCALFQGICHNTDDHIEALNAALEKRAAVYRGS